MDVQSQTDRPCIEATSRQFTGQFGAAHDDHGREPRRPAERTGQEMELLPHGRGAAMSLVDDQEPAPAVGGVVLEGRPDSQSHRPQSIRHWQTQGVCDQSEKLQGIEC